MDNKTITISTAPRLASMLLAFVFLLAGQMLFAQSKQVTGVVKDVTGETVIGASVVEKGTTNGTITDFDGNFKLTVGDKAVLQISFVGYQTQEINTAGKASFVVTLKEDSEMLEEVVVVGYGAQKKESVVGAISQVSSKELLQSPAANVSQAIAGKISGVITSQTSGAPGSDDTQIYIRGRATFAGDAQPLVLVDGVEREFSQIAPDDIETISVLKDASATAVYGVRGANGVMLITTKRGREQKPEVSLTANWQIQSPTRHYDRRKKQPFPFLKNKDIYAVAVLEPGMKKEKIAIIPCNSGVFERLIAIPSARAALCWQRKITFLFPSESISEI